MNFSSASLACTKTTSASPWRAMLSAWPVPLATTFTSMPVLALNSGRMWRNRPESSVEVVEATTMLLSCAAASAGISRAAAAMQEHDVAGKAPRLAKVVRGHHDLDVALGDGANQVLERLGGRGIEARGRLVEE